jgi:eukaryotic-like serine/threonine-protein kinase
VIDFGLAALMTAPGDITRTADTIGTPVCMAPEQAKSPRDLTAAVDVYALGAVLTYALTGHLPLCAADAAGHAVRDRRPLGGIA